MNLDRYFNKASNVFAENRLLKFVIVVLGVAVCYNSYQTQKALDAQRTVLVPPVINSQVKIWGDRASEDYLREVARYVTFLAFNYSYSNARSQFDELLTMYSPSTYEKGKRTFYEIADQVETGNVISLFNATKIVLNPDNAIEIQGNMRILKNDLRISEGVETYLIKYTIEQGRFQIVDIMKKQN